MMEVGGLILAGVIQLIITAYCLWTGWRFCVSYCDLQLINIREFHDKYSRRLTVLIVRYAIEVVIVTGILYIILRKICGVNTWWM